FTGLLGFDRKTDVMLIEILAYLRLKRHDTHAFLLVYPLLVKRLRAIPLALIDEMRRMVHTVWDYYYHLNEKFSLPFYLGVVMSSVGDHQAAVFFYQKALEEDSHNATARFNLAAGYNDLKAYDRALEVLEQLPEEYNTRQE